MQRRGAAVEVERQAPRQPVPAARRVDDVARAQLAVRGLDAHHAAVAHDRLQRAAALVQDRAELDRPRDEQRIEARPPRLEALPRARLVGAVGHEARRLAPADPYALVAREAGAEHPLEHAQLAQRRLDARVQRLAGPLALELAAVQQRDAQAGARARDRRRRARRPGARDRDVDVRRRSHYAVCTARHTPSARRTSSRDSAPAKIVAVSPSVTCSLRWSPGAGSCDSRRPNSTR